MSVRGALLLAGIGLILLASIFVPGWITWQQGIAWPWPMRVLALAVVCGGLLFFVLGAYGLLLALSPSYRREVEKHLNDPKHVARERIRIEKADFARRRKKQRERAD